MWLGISRGWGQEGFSGYCLLHLNNLSKKNMPSSTIEKVSENILLDQVPVNVHSKAGFFQHVLMEIPEYEHNF